VTSVSILPITQVARPTNAKQDNANNYGQWRNQFQVLIAGSNGYINSAYAAALASGKVPNNNIAPTSQESSSQSTYDIYSGYDSNVGAYSNAQASQSYRDCETACDADTTCNAFTYVGGNAGVGSGTCWLKQKLGKPTSAGSNVVTGTKTGKINLLSVVSAFYADMDVTSQVKTYKSGNNIVLDTTNLYTVFGDPFPGQWKTLTVLFTNGTAYRIFNAAENTGKFILAPSGTGSAPNVVDTFVAPNTATSAVFSAVWGKGQNPYQSVYNTFNSLLASKNTFTVENTLFGNLDTFYGTIKTGVVWYTQNGAVAAKAVREHYSYQF
jgi:hypothetical protein